MVPTPVIPSGERIYTPFFVDPVTERQFGAGTVGEVAIVFGQSDIARECRPNPLDGILVDIAGLSRITSFAGVRVVHVLPTEQHFFIEMPAVDEVSMVHDQDTGFGISRDGDSLGLYYSPTQFMRMARMLAKRRTLMGKARGPHEPKIWADVMTAGFMLRLNFSEEYLQVRWSKRREFIRTATGIMKKLFVPSDDLKIS